MKGEGVTGGRSGTGDSVHTGLKNVLFLGFLPYTNFPFNGVACHCLVFYIACVCCSRGARYSPAFTRPTGAAHWEILLRARAIETQSYVIAAAQCGEHSEKRQSYGGAGTGAK